MTAPLHVDVALALVFRDGRLLVTRRRAGAHLGGYWELPGGKMRAGETAEACAVREVEEETRVIAIARSTRSRIDWEYPERRVTLHPVECDWLRGDGELVEVSDLVWATRADLSALVFPPANTGLIAELMASALLA